MEFLRSYYYSVLYYYKCFGRNRLNNHVVLLLVFFLLLFSSLIFTFHFMSIHSKNKFNLSFWFVHRSTVCPVLMDDFIQGIRVDGKINNGLHSVEHIKANFVSNFFICFPLERRSRCRKMICCKRKTICETVLLKLSARVDRVIKMAEAKDAC